MVFLFLGVPSFWHKVIALISGLIVIAIAYNLPPEQRKGPVNKSSVFVENNSINDIKPTQ